MLKAFAYSAQSDPLHLDYDTCVSHNRNKVGHITLNRREIRPPGTSPEGGYTIFEVDEIGRLTETVCDRLHRVVSLREYTGFCVPGTPVTSTDNRPTGTSSRAGSTAPTLKPPAPTMPTACARASLIRTAARNSSPTTATSGQVARCASVPIPRVLTLRSPGGEERVVTSTYQPDFGNPESARPGNPISQGSTIKGGKNPGL